MKMQELKTHLMKFPNLAIWAQLNCRSEREENVFWLWACDTWNAQQGEIIPVPKFMVTAAANELTSFICQAKADFMSHGGTVEIKRVAEIRGSRYNTGKPRMDLLDPIAVHGLVAVLTKGAEKYTAHNWRQGLPYMEIIASMQRHIFAIAAGEDIDPETGLQHADHIQCNAMFLSNMMKTRPDMDDRWKPLANTPEQVEAAFAADRKSS